MAATVAAEAARKYAGNPSRLMSRLLKARISDSTREAVQRMLRVDHAGEYGAVKIYEGQMAILGNTSEKETLKEMREHELEHLKKFNELLPKYRTRPTALLPLWHVGGFMLGAAPALFGKNAAYAITVAVEQNITEHYNDQVRSLIELMEEEKQKSKGSDVLSDDGDGKGQNPYVEDTDAILMELKEVFKQFRDEEQEHLETGLNRGAEQAPFFGTITSMVGAGCKAAIWASERI